MEKSDVRKSNFKLFMKQAQWLLFIMNVWGTKASLLKSC